VCTLSRWLNDQKQKLLRNWLISKMGSSLLWLLVGGAVTAVAAHGYVSFLYWSGNGYVADVDIRHVHYHVMDTKTYTGFLPTVSLALLVPSY